MFEQFRSFMGEIGYPPEKIRPLTFATYGDYARAYLNREVMLITTGWTMDYPDAENTMQLFYGPNATPGSNSANYDNPEYDALTEELAQTAVLEERAALVIQMNDMLMQEYVILPLTYRGRNSAHANSLGGVILNVWYSELWNIADWYRTDN